jgi:phage gp29-like protein
MSFVRCGYSIFEITHQVKMNDAELGPYTTLKSLGWRSQKTLNRWGVDQNGRLEYIEQLSYGDTGRFIKIPAEFIVHFCPKMEGSNFEGLSILRPMYGAWLRKNAFLKQNAIGNERAGTPTAVLKVPKGIEGSPEYDTAVEMASNYASGAQNMIIIPEGWEIEFNNTTYDPSRSVVVLDYEDGQIAKGIIGQFLMLGQASNGGSMALGSTLADFFTQTIRYLSDHIVETLNKRVLHPIVKMNLGDVPLMADLTCDALDEKASAQWASIMQILVNAGVLTPTIADEKLAREKLGLGELPEGTERVQPNLNPQAGGTA